MKSTRRPRAYRMKARAEAAAETQRGILEVAIRLFGDRLYGEVSLDDVARASGVTVQTVLRRFGSKEGLAKAASEVALVSVRQQRWSAPVGDLEACVRDLMTHYEEWGERSLRFLSQEALSAPMKRVTDEGRAVHHEWVDHAFAPWLATVRGAARAGLRARLIACTDVYVWKIFRRDLGMDSRAAEKSLRALVEAVIA